MSHILDSLTAALVHAYAAGCALACLAPALAWSDTGQLEEIVVTAQFRALPAQQVAASIEVLDAATIADSTVQHFEELTHLVPNLNWAGGASRPRYFQIRGIGERSQYEGAPNPSVGFVIDNLDFSALGGVATMFDVEQVEVLRGPQGTRYGANALAGLIYVRSHAPTDVPDAKLELQMGSDETRSIGAAVGGPLSDALSYRAVLHHYRSDGFRANPYLGRDDTNGRDELTSRLRLRWLPAASLRADLTVMYSEIDNGYDAFSVDNGLTTYSDRPGRDAQESLGAVLELEAELGPALRLVSISGAARSDVEFSFDADWGNEQFWAPVIYDFFSVTERDRQSLNQEFRLLSGPDGALFGGAGSWVLGAYVLDTRESNFTRDDGDFEGFAFASQIAREYQATSSALFADLHLALDTRWSLNAGLRYERRAASYMDSAGGRFDPDESNVGGQLALSWSASASTNLYARVSRGYKAGGFNLGLPAEAGNDALLFDAEFLWNYELGVKARWLDQRLGFAATAFWMRRTEQQVQTSTQLDPNNPATFVFLTDNAGKGRNVGLELSADLQVSAQLALYANLGLLDTEIEDSGTDDTLDGREQAHAPGWSYAIGGRLDFADHWFTRLDVTGKDAFFFSDSHGQKSEPYTLVNARIGIERTRWSLYAWGRNLFDQDYAVRGFFFGNEPARDFADTLYIRRGDPRHYGVSFQYRYQP